MAMNPRLLRPLATGFDPRRIAGLAGWWDASDENSVTRDSGRVATWADKSGNGRNATNSVSGSTQPTYDTASVNGRNAVGFTAANNSFLATPSITLPASFTVLSVVTRPSSSTNTMTLGTIAGGSDFRYPFLWFFSDNNIYHWSSTNNTSFGTESTATGTFAITARRIGTSSLLMRRNGAEVATVTTGLAIENAASGAFTAMGRLESVYMNGRICEVLFYSRDLSNAEIAAAEQYLARKWGITL